MCESAVIVHIIVTGEIGLQWLIVLATYIEKGTYKFARIHSCIIQLGVSAF